MEAAIASASDGTTAAAVHGRAPESGKEASSSRAAGGSQTQRKGRSRVSKPKQAAKPIADAGETKPLPTSGELTAAAAKKRANRKKKKNKSKKKADKENRDGGEAGPKIKLKVVVRRLPPNLPESVFWTSIAPWARKPDSGGPTEQVQRASDQPVDQQSETPNASAMLEQGYFVPGKLKDGSRRGIQADSDASPHTFSRAYLRFKSPEALIHFHQGFDGHLFRDAKGNEYTAVVEFAPYQKMPFDAGRRGRADALQGTIEEDADYKQFLEALVEGDKADKGAGHTEKTDAQLMAHLTSLTAESNMGKQSKSTPLLEHLRAQRTAKAEASALKQARNYLNKSHGAYAAASGKSTVDKSTKKGKAKASHDPAIPTGPKAMRKKEKDEGQRPSKKDKKADPKENLAAATAPVSGKPKKDRKHGKGGANAGKQDDKPATDPPSAVAILKRDPGSPAPATSNPAPPAGPTAGEGTEKAPSKGSKARRPQRGGKAAGGSNAAQRGGRPSVATVPGGHPAG